MSTNMSTTTNRHICLMNIPAIPPERDLLEVRTAVLNAITSPGIAEEVRRATENVAESYHRGDRRTRQDCWQMFCSQVIEHMGEATSPADFQWTVRDILTGRCDHRPFLDLPSTTTFDIAANGPRRHSPTGGGV